MQSHHIINTSSCELLFFVEMMISLLRVLLLVRQGTGGVERGERRRDVKKKERRGGKIRMR